MSNEKEKDEKEHEKRMQTKIEGKRYKFTPDVVSIAVALLVSWEGGWGGGVRARLLARHHAGDDQLTVTVTRMMMMMMILRKSCMLAFCP